MYSKSPAAATLPPPPVAPVSPGAFERNAAPAADSISADYMRSLPLAAVDFRSAAAAARVVDLLGRDGLPRTTVQLMLEDTDKPHLVVSYAHEDITATEVLKALSSHVALPGGLQARFADYDAYFRSQAGERLDDRVARLNPGIQASGSLPRAEVQRLLAFEHSIDQQVAAHAQGGLEIA